MLEKLGIRWRLVYLRFSYQKSHNCWNFNFKTPFKVGGLFIKTYIVFRIYTWDYSNVFHIFWTSHLYIERVYTIPYSPYSLYIFDGVGTIQWFFGWKRLQFNSFSSYLSIYFSKQFNIFSIMKTFCINSKYIKCQKLLAFRMLQLAIFIYIIMSFALFPGKSCQA